MVSLVMFGRFSQILKELGVQGTAPASEVFLHALPGAVNAYVLIS